jgi:hypothetical protein
MSPQELFSLAKVALHEPADRIRDLVEARANALTPKQRREAAFSALKQAAAFVSKQRWGRVRTWLLVAFALAPHSAAVWQHAIRLQVLSVGSIDAASRHKLWAQLASEPATALSDFHAGLARRIETLASLDRLREQLRSRFRAYMDALRNRPVGLLKSALAYTDLAFRSERAGFHNDAMIIEGTDAQILVGGPEELAECISTLVAEAVKQTDIHPMETGMPAALHVDSDLLSESVATAALRLKYRSLCKHVDALNYEIREEAHEHARAYVLTAPSPDHELWLRHAYAETYVEALATPLQVDVGVPLLRLRDVYAHLIETQRAAGEPILELRSTPYRRYVVTLPWEFVFRRLLNGSFYEDFHDHHMEALELQLDRDAVAALEIVPGLTGKEFQTLSRSLRYFALLHADVVATIDEDDTEATYNSLLPVVPRAELSRLLSYTGLAAEKVEVFIDVVSVSLHGTAHIDLQYTPLIKNGASFLLLPRIAATSAALRNTLANARRRVPDAGHTFGAAVADRLAELFGTAVASSKKLDSPDIGSTDVDVASFHDHTLYLWECKHSLPPTSTHESRDVWRDIEHAVEQLTRAERILSNDPNLEHRLRTWFPSVPKESLRVDRIVPVVMLSTRMWSGMHLDGIAVRDIHSLMRVFAGDRFGIPVDRDNNPYEFERFGMPVTPPIGMSELDDYLAPTSRYWSLRRAWNTPLSVVHARDRDLVIAHETTFAGPYDYDGLVPDALAHGYQSLGRRTRRPNVQLLDDVIATTDGEHEQTHNEE